MTNPIIKKIPGNPVHWKSEKEGFIGNLALLSKPQLLELLERQHKILKNRFFVEKLPDKGEKVKIFRDEIRRHLKNYEENDKLCGLLSNLDIHKTQEELDNLEWTGSRFKSKSVVNDKINEDETDLLAMLATHSGTHSSKSKIVRNEDFSLIIPSDIKEDFELSNSNVLSDKQQQNSLNSDLKKSITTNSTLSDHEVNIEEYAKQLCHRFDTEKKDEKVKEKFFTNKAIKQNTCNNIKHFREITAASPPNVTTNRSAKLISLQESIVLYKEQMDKVSELQISRAIDKLGEKSHIKMKGLTRVPLDYRNPHEESESDATDNEGYETAHAD